MAEYLERESILNGIRKASNLYVDQQGLYLSCELIAAMPATDVQPVKRGRWENEYLDDDIWWAECSNCKQETHSRYGRPSTYRYCPNCGARMDGDTKK